jgi:peptidoglycan/LPS O-acetylase OafA/YrhL
MLLFMAYHFGVTGLAGAWVLINLFFVISGFLIARLLVQERLSTGRIDVVNFYRRRARRLLPGLFLLLSVLVLLAVLGVGGIDRRRLGGDVLATLAFVMNWRLVGQGDQYFGDQTTSLLRHAWTLAIEEQFYVTIPFLILGLVVLVRTRRARVGVLLAGAALATLWTAHFGAVDSGKFPRLYYGTDTRLAPLLIGAAMGVLLARGHGGWPVSRTTVERLGLLGMVAMIASVVFVDPFAHWMYQQGGITALALAQAAAVAACVDPRGNLITRALNIRPLEHAGRMIYALYLWHWPVAVFLTGRELLGSKLVTNVLGFLAAIALAYLSDRFIETPVLRGGVRALLPRQPWRNLVAWGVPLALVVVAVGVLRPSPPQNRIVVTPATAADVPVMVPGQPEYAAGRPASVALSGDSFAWYLAERFPAKTFPGVSVLNVAGEGCDLTELPQDTGYGLKYPDTWCLENEKALPGKVKERAPDAFVQFATILIAVHHKLPDGRVLGLGDADYEKLVFAALDARLRTTLDNGAKRFFLVNLPCRKVELPPGQTEQSLTAFAKENRAEMLAPDRTNALLARWAAGHPEVTIVDLHAAVCGGGFRDTIAGVKFSNDGLHVSPEATPMVWRWLLGQLSRDLG